MFISTTTFRGASSSAARIKVQFPDQGSTQAVRNHAAAKLKFTQMGYSEYNYGGNAFHGQALLQDG